MVEVHEVDEGRARCWKPVGEQTVEEAMGELMGGTMQELMLGGSREERMAGEIPEQPRRRRESKHGGSGAKEVF